jgi:hypothetical protein
LKLFHIIIKLEIVIPNKKKKNIIGFQVQWIGHKPQPKIKVFWRVLIEEETQGHKPSKGKYAGPNTETGPTECSGMQAHDFRCTGKAVCLIYVCIALMFSAILYDIWISLSSGLVWFGWLMNFSFSGCIHSCL